MRGWCGTMSIMVAVLVGTGTSKDDSEGVHFRLSSELQVLTV